VGLVNLCMFPCLVETLNTNSSNTCTCSRHLMILEHSNQWQAAYHSPDQSLQKRITTLDLLILLVGFSKCKRRPRWSEFAGVSQNSKSLAMGDDKIYNKGTGVCGVMCRNRYNLCERETCTKQFWKPAKDGRWQGIYGCTKQSKEVTVWAIEKGL
jgi:hypothetical protein